MSFFLKFFLLIIFFIFYFQLSSADAFAKSKADKIRISTGDHYPYTSKKLPNKGCLLKIVTDIFESQNIEVEYKFFPWRISYNLAKKGESIDASVYWYRSSEREKYFFKMKLL